MELNCTCLVFNSENNNCPQLTALVLVRWAKYPAPDTYSACGTFKISSIIGRVDPRVESKFAQKMVAVNAGHVHSGGGHESAN